MRANIRGGSDWDVLVGHVDGVRIIDLRASKYLSSSPLYGQGAMIWGPTYGVVTIGISVEGETRDVGGL